MPTGTAFPTEQRAAHRVWFVLLTSRLCLLCYFPENGVSRGAHVPVCPGHDVLAGPGGAGGLCRAQDRPGSPALRPGEVSSLPFPAPVLQTNTLAYLHRPLLAGPGGLWLSGGSYLVWELHLLVLGAYSGPELRPHS